MVIKARCLCGKAINAPDSAAGKRGKCPECGKPIRIPVPEPEFNDEEFEDDFEDDYVDDWGEAELPKPRKKKPSGQTAKKERPSRKNDGKASEKSSARLPLVLGGSLVGGMLIGGILYAALGGGGANTETSDEVPGASITQPSDENRAGSKTDAAGGENGGVAQKSGRNADGTGVDANQSKVAAAPNAPHTKAQEPALQRGKAGMAAAESESEQPLWIVVSNFKFKQQLGPALMYQLNFEVVSGTPDPSKEYAVLVGRSSDFERQHFEEVSIDFEDTGGLGFTVGPAMIGQLRACVAVRDGQEEWKLISGVIKTDGEPTDSLPLK